MYRNWSIYRERLFFTAVQINGGVFVISHSYNKWVILWKLQHLRIYTARDIWRFYVQIGITCRLVHCVENIQKSVDCCLRCRGVVPTLRIEFSWTKTNAKRCVLHFKKNSHNFSRVVVSGNELLVCRSVVFAVTISAILKWNWEHKKADKRLYFIVHLKRANVPCSDVVAFYYITITPALEHCTPVYHHAPPQYLRDDIERVQKRVLYYFLFSVVKFGLDILYARRVVLCSKLFSSITSSPGHKLFPLLRPSNPLGITLGALEATARLARILLLEVAQNG